MRHYTRLDSGRTHLPLCSCGWRGIPTIRLEDAKRQLTDHARHVL